jgi:hypothetical protein
MTKLLSFTLGIVLGAYISQTYNIPKIADSTQKLFEKICEYEKINKKTNDK